MCITTFTNPNKTECSAPNGTSFLYFNSLKAAVSVLNKGDSNCSENGTSLTSFIIKELDVGNTLHRMEFNVSFNRNTSDNISEMDVSQYDFLNTIWVMLPAWEVALKSAAMAPVVAGGAVANLVLLLVLLRSRATRTPTNLLISSMALSDLATLLLCPWMLLVHHFYQNYLLGPVGCKMEGFLSGALLITGVMNLCAISYDRLTAIVLPQEARMSRCVAARLAVLSWLIGILFALPLSIWRYYKERQWKNFLETYCTENPDILPMYWHVLLFILVWFPLTIMTICYVAIFRKLDCYERKILRREHLLSCCYKTRVARTIFMVLVSFMICRLPFTVLVFWRNRQLKSAQVDWVDSAFQVLWFISHYLIYVNCAINPVIYGLTNENYRKALGLNPLYRWLSGDTKNNKDEQRTKERRPDDVKAKKRERYFRFWMIGGKLSFTEYDKDNTKSDLKKVGLCSSKITPLPEDNIYSIKIGL